MQLEFFKSKEYQLLREIGRGGMASVYEAIETAISRRVAIKILPPSAGLNKRQIERFRTEANIAAALDHPHIVPVFSVGNDQDAHFYSMKYIDGPSLAGYLDEMRRSNDLPSSSAYFRKVAIWGIQAAEALHYAHSKNVIHGDIKPGNLLVDSDGSLWLVDFGAASCNGTPQGNMKTNVTGTLRYMSPEQVSECASAFDHRSDQYSLGATLFELVALKPFIDGEGSSEILTKIAFRTPSRSGHCNPAVPVMLDAILCRATARDPQPRYATASELADDLRQFLIGQQTTTLVASQSKRWNQRIRRVRVGLTASVVAAIVGIGSLSYMAVQSSVAKVDLKNDLQNELANSYYRLGVSHGQQCEYSLQEKMLQQSIEIWEKLALRHGTPRFRFNAPFACLTMAQLYYDTGRIREAKEKGEEAIVQFSSLHQFEPEDSLVTFGLACAHARVGAMLAQVLTVTAADYPNIASYRFGFATAAHAFGGALQSSGKASSMAIPCLSCRLLPDLSRLRWNWPSTRPQPSVLFPAIRKEHSKVPPVRRELDRRTLDLAMRRITASGLQASHDLRGGSDFP